VAPAPTVQRMERQAGLGRSLGDVLDSLTPVETDDAAPRHALFGLGSDDASTTNGSTANGSTDPSTKKHKKKSAKKSKKKKKKSKKT